MDRFILYPLFLTSLAVIGFLAWQLFEYATALPAWQAALTRTTASLDAANREIGNLEQTAAQLRADVAAATTAQQSTAQQLEIYRKTLREANDNVNQANATIQKQDQWLRTARDLLNTARDDLDTAQESLSSAQAELAVQKLATQGLEQLVRDRDSTITTLRGEIQSKDSQITRQNTQIRQQRTQISSQTTTISNLRTSLRQAQNQQVKIPACSTNYYTAIGGQLSCVNRNTAAFQATQVETRSINLPRTGRVTLKINRSGELGSDQSMEILEHSVRTIEEYMGQPMPLQGREIRLDFVNELTGLAGDFAGSNDGTRMEILQEYDADDLQTGSSFCDNIGQDDPLSVFCDSFSSAQYSALGTIIAHEVAHYYWADERIWLDEGAADFLARYSENRRTGVPIRAQNRRCYQVSNISQLESQRYGKADAGFRCNYSLGEGLFVDLYDSLTPTGFQQSFRELYASGENKLAGIHQVRQAYPSSWAIIDEWYGYREKPEAHWPNGEFLGYLTWQEGSDWKLNATRSGQPCATTLRRNESQLGWYVRATRDYCHYTGTWSKEGDLLVTISGTTYRAVDVEISQPPRYGPAVAVQPGNSIPSPTFTPLAEAL